MTNDAFIDADSILNSSSVAHSHSPQRCFLPVVKINVKNGSTESFATSVLDSCSELNIITPRCYDQLKLRGEPIGISIVGAGGIVTQVRTMLVDFLVIDIFGIETRVECIVLRETCGKALQIDNVVIDGCSKVFNIDASKLYTGGEEIDFLVGMLSPDLHKQLSMKSAPSGISLLTTRFRPCIVGPAPKVSTGKCECGTFSVNKICILPEPIPDLLIRKHLECELAGICTDVVGVLKNQDEVQFEEKMKIAWAMERGSV